MGVKALTESYPKHPVSVTSWSDCLPLAPPPMNMYFGHLPVSTQTVNLPRAGTMSCTVPSPTPHPKAGAQ